MTFAAMEKRGRTTKTDSKMENIVIVKHIGGCGQYIFAVPDEKRLKEGDLVLVKSRRGESAATCVCDSFEIGGSPLKAILQMFGGKFPLALVTGYMEVTRWCDGGDSHD